MGSDFALIGSETRESGNSPEKNMLVFAEMVTYFAGYVNGEPPRGKPGPLYKTKLNKLLFYAQFLYYKKYGARLLNNEFIADYYGPVMDGLDECLEELESSKIIAIKNGDFGTKIVPLVRLRDDEYESKALLWVLNDVARKFDGCSARETSDYSHQEPLWQNTELKKPIPIARAGELRDFCI